MYSKAIVFEKTHPLRTHFRAVFAADQILFETAWRHYLIVEPWPPGKDSYIFGFSWLGPASHLLKWQ
jgi:hypothetical protein